MTYHKIAISTPHKWQFKRVLEIKKIDMPRANWDSYYENTCLRVENNDFGYASKGWYENKGYKIISFKEFLTRQSQVELLRNLRREGKMKYKVGDVLENSIGERKTILGICGKIYFMSLRTNSERYGEGYTIQELEQDNFYLPSPTTEVLGKKYLEELRQIVIEDVPHKYQKRLLDKLYNSD